MSQLLNVTTDYASQYGRDLLLNFTGRCGCGFYYFFASSISGSGGIIRNAGNRASAPFRAWNIGTVCRLCH